MNLRQLSHGVPVFLQGSAQLTGDEVKGGGIVFLDRAGTQLSNPILHIQNYFHLDPSLELYSDSQRKRMIPNLSRIFYTADTVAYLSV